MKTNVNTIQRTTQNQKVDTSSPRTRIGRGSTPTLQCWGSKCEYDKLTDLLLGPVENYKWLATSSLSKKKIRRGRVYDFETAKAQSKEMF